MSVWYLHEDFPLADIPLSTSCFAYPRRWPCASWWSCLLNAHLRQRVRGRRRMYKTFMYSGWMYIVRGRRSIVFEEDFRFVLSSASSWRGVDIYCRGFCLAAIRPIFESFREQMCICFVARYRVAKESCSSGSMWISVRFSSSRDCFLDRTTVTYTECLSRVRYTPGWIRNFVTAKRVQRLRPTSHFIRISFLFFFCTERFDIKTVVDPIISSPLRATF